MGEYRVTDRRTDNVLEPTWITLQAPLTLRANPQALGDLPIAAPGGVTVPLAELGHWERIAEDPIIYHKDLRPVEYVVGDAVGRLGAPIYPMMKIDETLQDYVTPDDQTLSGTMTGPPPANGQSGFEWTGEWTITYETFRDMGAAFGVALVLILSLIHISEPTRR